MARLEGFEPPAYGLEVRCSIQLSYRRPTAILYHKRRRLSTAERTSRRIEATRNLLDRAGV